MGSRIFGLLLFLHILSSSALAGTIEVISPDLIDTFQLELPADRTADLTIYLQSFGDVLSDTPVLLLSDPDGNKVGQRIARSDGVVTFEKVPAGKYKAIVGLSRERRRRTTVRVGDMRIAVTPAQK